MKLEERKQILRDVVDFKKTDRIPTTSNFWTWTILDSGYKLSEGLYDYDVLYKAVTDFHKKYCFDLYNYFGDRNPFRVADAAGGNSYEIDDEKGIISLKDRCYMKEDEYPLLIENHFKFVWTVITRRSSPKFTGPGCEEAFFDTIKEMGLFNESNARIRDTYVNEFGVPVPAALSVRAPIEMMMGIYRGIKNLSVDLRRRYDEVKAACNSIAMTTGLEQSIAALEGPAPDDAAYDVWSTFLAHSILNQKQFDDLFWVYIGRLMDKCVEKNRKFYIFCESEFLRFSDYLKDIPRGTVLFAPEEDDIFELRRTLPNIALAGGMTTELLGGGTKAECLDYAKKLVDELGRDGGFVMGQKKMISYRNDAKSENVLAVQEFCRECK